MNKAQEKAEKTFNKIKIPFTAENKAFEIQSDLHNYIIARIGKDKHGNRKTTPIKFYPTLDSCLTAVLNLKVKGTPASTLEDLLDSISSAENSISRLYKLTVDTENMEE